MSIDRSRLFNLIAGIQFKDPKLYEVLRELTLELEAAQNPIDTESRLDDLEAGVVPADIAVCSFSFTKRNVILSWQNPEPGTIKFYEIRQGTDWDTANKILVTATTQAVFAPLLVGTTSYLIKTLNIAGVESANAKQLDVIVPALGSTTPTFNVIDNNVLLYWTEPTSVFDIARYDIYKGAALIGTLTGTFTIIYEIASGTFTYQIVPVDIAGNQGLGNDVTVSVTQPADYELADELLDNLTGTKVKCVIKE